MFRQTLLKSADDKKSHSYAKNLTTGQISWPFLNYFTEVTDKTFEEFVSRQRDLLDKPTLTSILGVPTKKLLLDQEEANTPLKVRRLGHNFTYFPNQSNPDIEGIGSVKYQYVILDIDGPNKNDSIPKDQRGPNLPESFLELQKEGALSPESIIETAKRYVQAFLLPLYSAETDIESLPDVEFMVRLSASFAAEGKKDMFRGHIVVPLPNEIELSTLYNYIYQFAWLDSSFYRNPTQPVFTARPITADQNVSPDPLGPLALNLQRIHYNKTGIFLSESLVSETNLNKVSNELGKLPSNPAFNRNKSAQGKRLLKAIALPGKKGVFNRSALVDENLSAHKWLTDNGYERVGVETRSSNEESKDENGSCIRYISPTSDSGQAGLVIYPTGFIKDFHGDESPINQLLKRANYGSHLLSPYDLYLLSAIDTDTVDRFQTQVKKLVEVDSIYQDYIYRTIESSLGYVYKDMPDAQVDLIVKYIVEEIFFSGLEPHKRTRAFHKILATVKLKKDASYRLTKSDLEQMYNDLRQSFALDRQEIHPSNRDSLNAQVFLEKARIFKIPHHNMFLVESHDGTTLDAVDNEDSLTQRLYALIKFHSLEAAEWNHAKLVSLIKSIIMDLRAMADFDPFYKSPKIDEGIYSLKNTSNALSLGIDRGHTTFKLSLDVAVINHLPFTKTVFENCREDKAYQEWKRKGEWLQFLDRSFPDSPHRIELVRNLFTYLLTGNRKEQIVYSFTGVPRSGKSIIKSVIKALLPRSATFETEPTSFAEQFGKAKLTQYTRLIVLNEFNMTRMGKRSSARSHLIEDLKAISGKDGIIIRQMRTDPIEMQTDALPLLIGNEAPDIQDKAFTARLVPVLFEHSFSETSLGSRNFAEYFIRDELPYIFLWALKNPNLKEDGTVRLHVKQVESQKAEQQDRAELSKASDLQSYFDKTFIEEAPSRPNRHGGFWDDSIATKEYLYWYSRYFEMQNGYSIDMDPNIVPHMLMGYKRFRDVSPQCRMVKVKGRKNLYEGQHATSYHKEMLEQISHVEPAVRGIKWKNVEEMAKELSPFGELEQISKRSGDHESSAVSN